MKKTKVIVCYDENNDLKGYKDLMMSNDDPSYSLTFIDYKDFKNDLTGIKLVYLLIGKKTKESESIKNVLELTKKEDIPLICVNLNNNRIMDTLTPTYLQGYFRVYTPNNDEALKYVTKMFLNDYKLLHARYGAMPLYLTKEYFNKLKIED